MAVEFHFEHPVVLKERTRLKRFLLSIFETEKKEVDSLTYIFCSDDYLLDINKRFLNHDYYTDIVTFSLANHPNDPIIGEIYISIERVLENASSHTVPKTQELHRVIFHGLLHLCGYRDKSRTEKIKMREKEDFYLRLYGLL